MTTTTATQKWTIDPVHSTVGFSVRHLMITNVRGEFQKVKGEVVYEPGQPSATQINAEIEVASINTRDAQRDTHLKSADFFDAEKYPTITFAGKSAKPAGEGKLEVTGGLTIHGTTRDVTLAVSDITGEQADPWGNRRIGATATTKIKRSDFGIVWNTVLEAGGIAVGDEITITLDVSLVKAK